MLGESCLFPTVSDPVCVSRGEPPWRSGVVVPCVGVSVPGVRPQDRRLPPYRRRYRRYREVRGPLPFPTKVCREPVRVSRPVNCLFTFLHSSVGTGQGVGMGKVLNPTLDINLSSFSLSVRVWTVRLGRPSGPVGLGRTSTGLPPTVDTPEV